MLDYGLWKSVIGQNAAETHHDATFDFEVTKETDYHTTGSAYF